MEKNNQRADTQDARSWVHVNVYEDKMSNLDVCIRGNDDAFNLMLTLAKFFLKEKQMHLMLVSIMGRYIRDAEFRKQFDADGTEFDPRVFQDILKKK